MVKEIKNQEMNKPNVYPPFEEAVKEFSMDEIYNMAKATYLLQIRKVGGVIND